MSLESMQAVLRRQDRFRTIVTVLLLIWLIVLWFMGDPKKTAPLPAVADQAAAIADLEHDAQPKAELESAVTETETSADAASVDSSAVAEQPEQTAGAAEDNAPDSIGNLMLSAADASSDADSHSEPAQEPEPAALSVVAPTTTEESASAALAEETVTPQGERQPTESVDEPVMPAEEPLAASEPQAHEVAKSMGPLVSSVVGHQDSRPSSATSPEPETSTASVDTPEVPTGSAVTKEPTSPAPPYEEQAGPVPENGTPYGRMVRRMGEARRAFWDGRPEQAIALYRESADLDQENFLAMEEMARVYANALKQPTEAARAYGEALQRVLPLGYQARAKVLMRQILELDPLHAIQLNHQLAGRPGFPMDLEHLARMIDVP